MPDQHQFYPSSEGGIDISEGDQGFYADIDEMRIHLTESQLEELSSKADHALQDHEISSTRF